MSKPIKEQLAEVEEALRKKTKQYDSLAGQVEDLHNKLDQGYQAQLRLAGEAASAAEDVNNHKQIVRDHFQVAQDKERELLEEVKRLRALLKENGINPDGNLNRLGD